MSKSNLEKLPVKSMLIFDKFFILISFYIKFSVTVFVFLSNFIAENS